MALTPYLKLQKPPFDSIPWDQAINGNMDILDSTIAQFLSVPGYSGTWTNATNYTTGQVVLDATNATMWQCLVSHTSAALPTTFAQDRTANPTYWSNTTTAPVVPVDQRNVGRNLLHNSLFNVQQRGPGPFSGGYALDRWSSVSVGGTVQVTSAPMSDADRAAISDESAIQSYHNIFTGSSGVNDYLFVAWQPIESVRRLSGKTVTVSFWAKAAAGTPKLGVNFYQNFGSGGSPSAGIYTTAQAFTLSTTWTRFISAPFVLPSTNGKTLGTGGNDYTQLILWGSAGANNSTLSGGIGVQSSTVDIWGVQLEIGSAVTPLEKPDPQQDLAKCQRFYSIISIWLQAYAAASVPFGQTVTLPVSMRALPSIVFGSVTYTNASGLALASNSNLSPAFVAIATSLGTVQVAATLAASADL